MDETQQGKVLSVAKHLVTLSLAALGFVITIMFASSGGEPFIKLTEYKNSMQTSLILFLCTVVLGFLVEASILSASLGDRQWLLLTRPVFLLVLAWMSFVFASVALIVFALATTFGGSAINF